MVAAAIDIPLPPWRLPAILPAAVSLIWAVEEVRVARYRASLRGASC